MYEVNEFEPRVEIKKKIIDFLGFNFWDDGSQSLRNQLEVYMIKHGLGFSQLSKNLGIDKRVLYRLVSGKEISTINLQKILGILQMG